MTDLKVTQIRSAIGKPESLRKVLAGMGLRKRHHSVILPDTPEVRGMIFKVPHLVRVERVPAGSRRSARARAAAEQK
jgi:large subunit ribosomal protein L30